MEKSRVMGSEEVLFRGKGIGIEKWRVSREEGVKEPVARREVLTGLF